MKRRINALRRMAAGIVMVAAIAWTGLAESVTNVRGVQREKSGFVDIYYDLEASESGLYTVKVEIEGRTNDVKAATFTGDVGSGVTPGKNRHIVWDAGTDWPGKKGDVKAKVTATKVEQGGQLWEEGPYWADRNVGASAPEDYGLYFWWGDTVGYRPSGANCPTYNKNIDTLLSEGWIVNNNGTYVLAPEHDAAQVQWGGGWRMPTYSELSALKSNCDWTWTTQNGVNGYVVRGRGAYASNSIFLPCAGHGDGTSLPSAGSYGFYWSSVPASDDAWDWAGGLCFYSGNFYTSYGWRRYYGQSVRPVRGSAQ